MKVRSTTNWGDQMKVKKTPLRKCLGCNEMKPKKELLRVVRNSQGIIGMDTTGKAQGRGAYICKTERCFKKAGETKALERALKSSISKEVYEDIMKELIKNE